MAGRRFSLMSDMTTGGVAGTWKTGQLIVMPNTSGNRARLVRARAVPGRESPQDINLRMRAIPTTTAADAGTGASATANIRAKDSAGVATWATAKDTMTVEPVTLGLPMLADGMNGRGKIDTGEISERMNSEWGPNQNLCIQLEDNGTAVKVTLFTDWEEF